MIFRINAQIVVFLLASFLNSPIMRDFVADGNRPNSLFRRLDEIDLLAACSVLTRTGSKTGCCEQKKLEI